MRQKSKHTASKGKVYLLRMVLQCGTVVYKVGATSRLVRTRLGEILLGINDALGYVPYTRIVTSVECVDYYGAEASIHKRCKNNRYMFDVEFTGSSEFFLGIDEELVSKWIASSRAEFGSVHRNSVDKELNDIDELLTMYV